MPNASELIDESIAQTPDWRGATFAKLRRNDPQGRPGDNRGTQMVPPEQPPGRACLRA